MINHQDSSKKIKPEIVMIQIPCDTLEWVYHIPLKINISYI
jgi:hypothetical protein